LIGGERFAPWVAQGTRPRRSDMSAPALNGLARSQGANGGRRPVCRFLSVVLARRSTMRRQAPDAVCLQAILLLLYSCARQDLRDSFLPAAGVVTRRPFAGHDARLQRRDARANSPCWRHALARMLHAHPAVSALNQRQIQSLMARRCCPHARLEGLIEVILKDALHQPQAVRVLVRLFSRRCVGKNALDCAGSCPTARAPQASPKAATSARPPRN